ncbi:MAG: hypothetical protein NUV50_04475 [Rhodospirillales bacterium]|nr:hypothetical protein [Rhodospirillales bacterium]
MLRLLAVVVALSIFVSTTVEAQENMSKSDMLLVAFARTCLKYPGKPAVLKAELESKQKPSFPKLPSNASQAFLGNSKGDGWVLPPQLGNAVLIVRTDGVCSIFVRRWGEEGFVSKLEQLFNDKNSSLSLKEKGRAEGPLSTITWGLYPSGKYKALLESKGMNTSQEMFGIVLSTSDDPNGNFQLAISLAAPQTAN